MYTKIFLCDIHYIKGCLIENKNNMNFMFSILCDMSFTFTPVIKLALTYCGDCDSFGGKCFH